MRKREGSKKPEKLEEEGQIDADLHFVMTMHTPENAEECAEELKKNGDIVALEFVGSSRGVRDAVTETVNRISELPEGEEREKLERIIEKDLGGYPFYRDLLKAMAGSGKRIELIDISNEDPEWEFFSETDEKDGSISQKLLFEHFEDAYSDYCQLIDDFAETVEARERVVARQLKEIAESANHPRISIFVGAAHAQPYIELKKGKGSGGARTRKFVPESSEEGKKQIYSYKIQAMRQKRFFKDREVPSALIERSMLEHLILGLAPSVGEMDSDVAEQERYIMAAIKPMTDVEVGGALNQVEKIKKRHVSFSETDEDPEKDFSEYEKELSEYLESLLKK